MGMGINFIILFDNIFHNYIETKYTVSDGSAEIYKALETGELVDSKKTITVEWYKHLQSNPELSKEVILHNQIL